MHESIRFGIELFGSGFRIFKSYQVLRLKLTRKKIRGFRSLHFCNETCLIAKSYRSSFHLYQRGLLYSSTVTFCSQVTIPFSVFGKIYICCIPVSGLAPCQCSTLGGHFTTSPFLIVCLG